MVRVGVGVIVRYSEHDSVISVECLVAGKRKGSHGSGYWALPGGHLEVGETVTECAVREVKEECGLDLDPASVKILGMTQDLHAEGKHYITLFVEAFVSSTSGLLENREPEKCEGWEWTNLTTLNYKKEECFLPLRHALETFLDYRSLGKSAFELNESLV